MVKEMKVILNGNEMKQINKNMDPITADGEYIGIAKFSAEGTTGIWPTEWRILGSRREARADVSAHDAGLLAGRGGLPA